MWDPRFFQTSRGKVLLHMKKQGACTVAYLSRQLGVTPNAIRQHLSALERDNLVTQRRVKTGPSKPALAFTLTARAESLFPKCYDSLLLGLVKELVHRQGKAGARHWLGQLGHSSAEGYVNELVNLTFEEKVEAIERILEASGSITEWERARQTLTVRDFNCPYGSLARDHPEVCEVQRGFLLRLLGPAEVDISCDHLKSRCEFQIRPPAEEESA